MKPEYKRILRFYGYDVDLETPKPKPEMKPLKPVSTIAPPPKTTTEEGEICESYPCLSRST